MKYHEDFVVGQEWVHAGRYALTEAEILEVGERWDPQPFHTDPVAAVSALGFDKLRLHLPARPGDELSVRAKVLECRASRSRPEVGIVRCSRELVNQRDELVFSDESAFLIQHRP